MRRETPAVHNLSRRTQEPQPIELHHGETVTPLFFGVRDSSLFGNLHLPRAIDRRRHAVLLCDPLGHEYGRSHAAFRTLANQLCRAGFPVLRFDYFGCGDSSGDADQFSIRQCQESIETAATFLRERTHCVDLLLIGRRIGATLATIHAQADTEVSGLVLWDPVVHGNSYLEGLEAAHSTYTSTARGRYLGPLGDTPSTPSNSPKEFLGLALSESTIHEIEAINLLRTHARTPPRAMLLSTGDRPISTAWIEHLTHSGVTVTTSQHKDAAFWTYEHPLQQFLPHGVLRSIVGWCGAAGE